MSQVISNLAVNGYQGVTVGGLGVTAKYFPAAYGASIGVASTKVGYILMPGGQRLNNQIVHVRVAGNAAPDPTIACPTFKVELVATPNYTNASPTYTTIASIPATAFGVTSGDAPLTQPWSIEADIQLDTTAGVLQGRYTSVFDNAIPASHGNVALDNALIVAAPTAEPPFALAVRVTFGTTAANNTASLFMFDANI